MNVLRICVSYDTTDAAFATQLMTDLRVSGAEIVTAPLRITAGMVPDGDPSPENPQDTTLEQLLHALGESGADPVLEANPVTPPPKDVHATAFEQLLHALGESETDHLPEADPVNHATPLPEDPHDAAFEQFLREELPRCQQLIVVQTPAALQSQRLQTIVEAALDYTQQGQMTAVLRVIAPTPNTSEAPVLPPTWASLPSFDDSLDYSRMLVRLCLHLGLTSPYQFPKAPPPTPYIQPPSPANGQKISNKPSVPASMQPDRDIQPPNPENRQKISNKPSVPASMQPDRDIQPPSPENGQKISNKPPVPDYMQPEAYMQLGSEIQSPSPEKENRQKKKKKGPQAGAAPIDKTPPGDNDPVGTRPGARPVHGPLLPPASRLSGRKPPTPRHAQQLNVKDRPQRPLKYPRGPRRSRKLIIAVSIAIFLLTTGTAIFSYIATSTSSKTLVVTPTPIPTPTPTPTPTPIPTPTPTPVIIIVTPPSSPTPPVPATLSNGTWQGQKTFANGQSPTDMLLTITVDQANNTFVGNLTETQLNSQFATAGNFTSTSTDTVSITFTDTLVLLQGTDMCSGCIYTATVSVSHKEMKGVWRFSGNGPQQGTIDLKQTA